MKRKIVWWTFTVLCASLILGLSFQSAPQSSGLSQSLAQSLLEQIPAYQALSPAEQVAVLATVHNLLRDIAHVVTFTALSFSASMLARSYAIKRWIVLVFLSCAAFAVLDESVQHFMQAGRAFEFVDLLKDWAGSLLGIGIVAVIVWKIRCGHQEGSSNGVSGTGAGQFN